MSFSGIVKFLLGFIIAIGLMIGAGVAAALYFVTKLTAPPPKPIFPNDKPIVKAQATAAQNPPRPSLTKSAAVTPTPTKTLVAQTPTAEEPSPTPTPSETPSPKPLEPGAYRARVTWSKGLSIRNGPNTESERIGGVGYNESIVVLSESEDKKWVKIRLEDGNTEGWVKAGNVEKVE
ncbi:SH3 domain-containing protein [Planktothrix sp. FACHB-1355]|uniref:SH3 domain-containing protein n=1 Tax=Aerosakkonema funiforme FACHB-1375 TaxID=2949571 RepID=A0A926VN11_9CYAN|nr:MULTISPECIES: SH3 domain-containing protein [Oscillatoriales]MBD2185832.1 SH3 domain-containing protein [Aerosakkonema funiforme FACHB-1375]MBD3561862.1 SH3 domain-containing protein [Planktothrix sp. FACHB-1355]